MKKLLLIFFVSLAFLVLFSGVTYAQEEGLVPCGTGDPTVKNPNPPPDLIPNRYWKRCELGHLAELIKRIFDFIILISTSLAGLGVIFGGILLLISGGNPGMANKGKHIVGWSILAVLLILGSWLIIRTILWALGVSPQFLL